MPDTNELDTSGLTPIGPSTTTTPTDAQGLGAGADEEAPTSDAGSPTDASAGSSTRASRSAPAAGLFDDLIPVADAAGSANPPHSIIVTPFGAALPVRWLDTPDGPVWCLTGRDALTLAGVHHTGTVLERIEAAVKRGGTVAVDPWGLGATPAPRLPLPPPPQDRSTADAILRKNCEPAAIELMEKLIDAVCSAPTWHDKANILIDEISHLMDNSTDYIREYLRNDRECFGASICGIVTLALEHIGDTEVRTVEAAAFLAISHHQQWREQGVTWLEMAGPTGRAWIEARPRFQAIARWCRSLHWDIQPWLTGSVPG